MTWIAAIVALYIVWTMSKRIYKPTVREDSPEPPTEFTSLRRGPSRPPALLAERDE